MANNVNGIPEIPIQEHRPKVPVTVQLKPDVDDFLTQYEKGRGDRDHVINAIVRIFRDCTPANKRGPREDPKSQPATSSDVASPQPKLAELKKAPNG